MTKQKWYQKATVQSALVTAGSTLLIALITIAAIVITWRTAEKQLDFAQVRSKIEYSNTKQQMKFMELQLDLAHKTFQYDSFVNSQQLALAQENLKILLAEKEIKHSADWGKLRNTMWELMELTSAGFEGYRGLEKLSSTEKQERSEKIWKLLNSEIGNPVLIENKKCLGYWRNAISKAKSLRDGSLSEIFSYSDQVSKLMNDVIVVWIDLVLHSDEVSATGGKPNL